MSGPNLVFRNGTVLTMDDDFNIASAVALRDSQIVAVGSDAEIDALVGSTTQVIDLAGATLLPGINDAHLHGCRLGLTRPPLAIDLSFPSVTTIDQVVAAVEQAVTRAAPGSWIRGRGWHEAVLQPGERSDALPHRRYLDAVSPRNPVCLTDFSGHAVWVNSAALEAAGVSSVDDIPSGGIADTVDGELTGVLREGAVMLIEAAVPPRSISDFEDGIRAGLVECHRRGITSYTDPGLTLDEIEAYRNLERAGELKMRVTGLYLAQRAVGSSGDFVAALDRLPADLGTDPRRFKLAGVKIFADGIPPHRTAWMSEPYEGGGHGCLNMHGETDDHKIAELKTMVAEAHKRGHQIGVHVTGDRAIDAVVESFVEAQTSDPKPDLRHYAIHADFLSAASMRLLAAHDFGANMNPTIKWVIADAEKAVVGAERADYEMPYRDALDAGVVVTSGSDAPVTQPDWLQGLSTLMLRESRDSKRVSGPDQVLGFADALRTYTTAAAWQDHAEAWKGSIEVGKVADLCVVDGDLASIDPHDIPSLKVTHTVVDGEIVHASR